MQLNPDKSPISRFHPGRHWTICVGSSSRAPQERLDCGSSAGASLVPRILGRGVENLQRRKGGRASRRDWVDGAVIHPSRRHQLTTADPASRRTRDVAWGWPRRRMRHPRRAPRGSGTEGIRDHGAKEPACEAACLLRASVRAKSPGASVGVWPRGGRSLCDCGNVVEMDVHDLTQRHHVCPVCLCFHQRQRDRFGEKSKQMLRLPSFPGIQRPH